MVLYSEPIGKSIFIRAAIAQYFEHLTIIHYLESRVSRHPWTFFSDSDRLRTYRDSPKSLSVIVAADVLIPGNRFEHYSADSDKELPDHICCRFLCHPVSDKGLIYGNRREDIHSRMLFQCFRAILIL